MSERVVHPRNGFVVALFYGERADAPEGERRLLIEIHETYNWWGQETSKAHHYDGWFLDSAKKFGVLTVGFISFDAADDAPPPFVERHNPGRIWRRLR